MNRREYRPSYWHSVGNKPLNPSTLGQIIDKAVDQWSDEEAFVSVYQNHRYTFKEAREKADRLAAGLLQLGLKSGDRLGIWGHVSSEWYIARLAAARGGFVTVQLDPAYQAPQLSYSLKKVEVKFLIASDIFKGNDCYTILKTVIPELLDYPSLGCEIICSQIPTLKCLIITSSQQYKGAYRFSDIIESAQPEFLNTIRDMQTEIQPDHATAILFSSGTTGTPKGVVLSHHNIISNIFGYGKRLQIRSKVSRFMITTQFCHSSGSLAGIILGMCFGSTGIVTAPVFDAKKALEGIIQERCTHAFATPSLFIDMIATSKKHDIKISTLEVATFGGAPCSQQLVEDIKNTLHVQKLVPGYGMTEASFISCSMPNDTLEQRLTTVGVIADHIEIKVIDKVGKIVPMGNPGELCVRGYNVMLGYFNDEEKTREFIGPDRWAKTGDLVVLQEDGHIRIVGRLKDMIIRIADNIFPSEIEDFFQSHPDVLETQAFGVPDDKVGEEICVYLRLKDGAVLKEDDLREYCKDKIADYRIPRYIRFVDEFERTPMGKVLKHRLLEKLKNELKN